MIPTKPSTLTFVLVGGSLLTKALAFLPLQAQTYKLTQDYSGVDFINNFQLFHDADPTGSFVTYADFAKANSTGLLGFLPQYQRPNSSSPAPVFLGSDASAKAPAGRLSTRFGSKQTFNRALIIADILHMPAPVCGVWPAYWMIGTAGPWPSAGEIDIVENVNDAQVNRYTVHTTAGIVVSNTTSYGDPGTGMTGNMLTHNCDTNAPEQDKNVGCSAVDFDNSGSYGDAFNKQSGGVFATLIDDLGVRIWFFNRTNIPKDIFDGTPNPPHLGNSTIQTQSSYWGLPNARFTGPDSQTLAARFQNMQIIFNTAFCGEWAGKIWSNNPTCSKLAPTCEDYVANHPEAFAEVYWAINSVKVYQLNPDSNSTAATAATTVTAAIVVRPQVSPLYTHRR